MRESDSRTVFSPLAVLCKKGFRTWIDCVAYLKRVRAGAALQSRGGQIDPNIDSIDTNVGIGIGSILA